MAQLTCTTGRLGSRARHDRIQASATAKPGLRNSDGWNDIPRLIQRRAPFTSDPNTGTRISPTSMTPAIAMPRRRAMSLLSSDAMNIVTRPSSCHWTCSVKK